MTKIKQGRLCCLYAGAGSNKVVAIIDAQKRITPHSVAQVIGYYSASRSSSDGIRAIELQKFELWKGEGRRMLDVRVLNLLLSLMHDESLLRRYDIEADKAQIPQGAQIPIHKIPVNNKVQ